MLACLVIDIIEVEGIISIIDICCKAVRISREALDRINLYLYRFRDIEKNPRPECWVGDREDL